MVVCVCVCVCACVLVTQACPTLHDPMDRSPPGSPLSMGFPRKEYWNEEPFPSLGDLPNPEIEPGFPALQADSLLTKPPRKPKCSGQLR